MFEGVKALIKGTDENVSVKGTMRVLYYYT